jgi:fermentation-respiration switch protein FrsA (DUF1100 family)
MFDAARQWDIHSPPNFDKSKKYPAIVSVHPFDGANEQTALIAGDWP